MSDRFHPITMEQLTGWVFGELEQKGSIFGIPQELFFRPDPDQRYRREVFGRGLDTPFGVAAGPHTQMAQNIVVAWLCGARFIELKTIQTLDELDVNKPCIDLQDEGYNVEWSQELKVYESLDEYLRAWVLIHALHRHLGFAGERPGMVFNMSVGYDYAGIQKPNVQWYFDTMDDASAYLGEYLALVAEHCPAVRDIEVPARLSDNVTLSTMHGCPPDEIESIVGYLIDQRGLHTYVKCNPTLLGPDRVRGILNEELGYTDIPVPDEAFGHDLKWADAVPMFRRLEAKAADAGVAFGLKLSNTLEVENWRTVFPGDPTMYMSGRGLHAITTNLAHNITEEFSGALPLSFAGGADCFNVADLLASGMQTITVCSDLLKSGGYLRLLQYLETTDAALDAARAVDLDALVVNTAAADPNATLPDDPAARVLAAARHNLAAYAARVRAERRLHKGAFDTAHSKTVRPLGLFDCIEAPCTDECPVDQKVPQYMAAVRDGDIAAAVELTRGDNPIPAILGHVCDHLCEHACVRTHLDEPLAIREMKRFIMEHERAPDAAPVAADRGRVAVIGAGPAGIAAAAELASSGFAVTVFERHPYAGGMVGGAIPTYRLPQEQIDQDLAVLERLGVAIEYGTEAGRDFTLSSLREEGYHATVIAVGAQLARRLGLEGEDAAGVLDGIGFLRSVREGDPIPIGKRVAVIGAGDTAMDCARSAWRLGAQVSIVYRRTIDQMPADREEVHALLDEGIEVVELTKPVGLVVEDGKLAALTCTRMEFRGERDAGGRKIPFEVEGSEFDLPFDTMLLAISQHSVLDFFGDDVPELTARGYLATDPGTLETTVPGVYAAGDVAAHGPASIVKAAADGKRAAAAIARRDLPGPEPQQTPDDIPALLRRRAHREWRVPVRHTPLEQRRSFDQTMYTYTAAEARTEAARCLDCQEMCSICVGVCPNLAILTYAAEPLEAEVPVVAVAGGVVTVRGVQSVAVDQSLQVAVLADFCNECGNCETFCPTAGAPYRDKPRLYLDREDFEAQSDNAFMVTANERGWSAEGRWSGATHRLDFDGGLLYTAPQVTACLHPDSWQVLEAAPGPAAAEGEISLEPCAVLYALGSGLRGSVPHLPSPVPAGTRIGAPGYAE